MVNSNVGLAFFVSVVWFGGFGGLILWFGDFRSRVCWMIWGFGAQGAHGFVVWGSKRIQGLRARGVAALGHIEKKV